MNRHPIIPFTRAWFYLRIIAPILWFFLVACVDSVSLALVTFWGGVPQKIDEIAVYWKIQAINRNWPLSMDTQLYWFFYILAWIMFLIGWVISSYLTVFLFRLIF